MNKIKMKAYAKVNLSLDITGKRPNGYHEVEMIMQQISLHDVVTLEKISSGISIHTNCPYIPSDHRNIVYQVAQEMMDQYQLSGGLSIDIEKNIPVAAGLAGGSADAAAVIMGMNNLFKLDLPLEVMKAFALKFGADIPFCIEGGAAIARGIGEELEPIKGLKDTWMVLVKPNIGVSTESVYKQVNISQIKKHPPTLKLKEAIEKNDLHNLSKYMYNVLEEVTGKNYPVIELLEKKLRSFNALGAMMSGSGPTVFGIYRNYKNAQKAYKNLLKTQREVFLVQAYQGGIKSE